MTREEKVLFRYLPVANITVGKVLLIKGRGEGIVRGILTSSYAYLTREGTSAHINELGGNALLVG